MKQIFIIEHLEPRVFKWCWIEYAHIFSIVGKGNLWFTNVKRGSKLLRRLGKVFKESVREMDLNDACVLDPEANKALNPKEARKCMYFIFGGILGDYPPKRRTRKELTKFVKDAKAFNIGKKQMSTDNAVFVVREISRGKRLGEMKFVDGLEIKLNKIESVDMPYRYALHDGRPVFSSKLIDYLKRKKGF